MGLIFVIRVDSVSALRVTPGAVGCDVAPIMLTLERHSRSSRVATLCDLTKATGSRDAWAKRPRAGSRARSATVMARALNTGNSRDRRPPIRAF